MIKLDNWSCGNCQESLKNPSRIQPKNRQRISKYPIIHWPADNGRQSGRILRDSSPEPPSQASLPSILPEHPSGAFLRSTPPATKITLHFIKDPFEIRPKLTLIIKYNCINWFINLCFFCLFCFVLLCLVFRKPSRITRNRPRISIGSPRIPTSIIDELIKAQNWIYVTRSM